MKKGLPIVLFCLLSLLPAFAEIPEDKTLSPYFYVTGDPAVDQLPLKDTHVRIAVSGVIADVTVTQTYENTGSRPIHARYVFPASTKAAVYGMRMRIGDQLVVAKCKERGQAANEFQQAKQAGKSVSLLEENRPNVFSMSVANVMPGDKIEIELHYTELLIPTDGIYELVYPTVVGPRYSSQPEASAPATDQWVKSPYLHQGELPKSQFHLAANVAAGVPIQDLSCPTHQVYPKWKNPAEAEITLEETDVFQANRDFILRYRLTGDQIASGLLLFRGKDENFFLYMAQPPVRIAEAEIPTREYIFVVDVSGSMSGFPLNTSKRLLRDLIRHLRSTDLFNVVLFAGGSRMLSAKSLPANEENIRRATDLIDQQSGGGGTELQAAMDRALKIPQNSNVSRTLVLVTDGYITAEAGVFKTIREHLDRTNVFAFGIGSSVNRYLIEGVARAGSGEPFVVTGPQEAEATAAKFREYIQTPVLTGIHVHATGFDTYDVEPVKLPDLFAQRPIILFGKWRGAPAGNFELEGVTGLGPYHARLNVADSIPADTNRALRYLWGRSRIAELSDFGSPNSEQIAQITSLGLTYNLLTQYTSFIAVHEVVRNPQGNGKDVDQPLPMPQGVSDLAIGGGVTTGAEPEMLWMAVLLLAMLGLVIARSHCGGSASANNRKQAAITRTIRNEE